VHGNTNQSLAWAVIEPNVTTALHKYLAAEELYHITSGTGRMTLDDEVFPVDTGDTILISPGTPHRITNTGVEPLTLLCTCAPPYSDGDTVLLD
jgi:mannose-6-phosphate isomerase-like protein (cupin superfamily)